MRRLTQTPYHCIARPFSGCSDDHPHIRTTHSGSTHAITPIAARSWRLLSHREASLTSSRKPAHANSLRECVIRFFLELIFAARAQTVPDAGKLRLGRDCSAVRGLPPTVAPKPRLSAIRLPTPSHRAEIRVTARLVPRR